MVRRVFSTRPDLVGPKMHLMMAYFRPTPIMKVPFLA